MRYKIKRFVGVICLQLTLILGLTGCKSEKAKEQETPPINSSLEDTGFEIQVPDEIPSSIQVEDGDVIDENGVLEYFLGENRDELLKAGYLKENWYEDNLLTWDCSKGGMELNYIYTYTLDDGVGRNSFIMLDSREAAGFRYKMMIREYMTSNVVSNSFRELYPETELDWCTGKEAIEACAPLAEACGYGDAEIKVYALTEEALNAYADDKYEEWEEYFSAPDPEFTGGDPWPEKKIPWTKEYEAYFLVYQSVLNETLLDSKIYNLCCVYVPKYGRVVYADCEQPLCLVRTLETISPAIQTDSLMKAIEDYQKENADSITITKLSMVYVPQYEKMMRNLEFRTVDPCWRIDYKVSESMKYSPGYDEDSWTVMVNAVDGSVIKNPS